MSDPDPTSAGGRTGRRGRRRSADARLADVAAHAGVSLATASRVLNGSTRIVAPGLAERVLASAAELRYAVNAQAQATALGMASGVSILVGDIDDPYFSAIASGVAEEADARGLTVSLGMAGTGRERLLPLLRSVRGQRPRGLVVSRSRFLDDDADEELAAAYRAVADAGTGISFVGTPPPGFPGVDVHHRAGARALVHRLLELGYRDLAVLAGPDDLVTAVERTAGFLTAARDGGAPIGDAAVQHGALTREGGFAAMTALLDRGSGAECVVAVTDAMAIGAYAALRARGLEPGRDLAVAGFDDVPPSRDVTPALSTVGLPLREIGRSALALALDLGSTVGPVEGTVLIRGSTPVRH